VTVTPLFTIVIYGAIFEWRRMCTTLITKHGAPTEFGQLQDEHIWVLGMCSSKDVPKRVWDL
jgi:hypothetical protein